MSKNNEQLSQVIAGYLRSASSSDAVAQGHLFGRGPVEELEKKLMDHFQMKHALCVSNATTGLLAIAIAIDLEAAEFITSPFTYGGSVAGWLLLKNVPIFADIDSGTLEILPSSIRGLITKQTKAILSVDSFGIPSDSRQLRQIADEFGLWYIADCSQSFGASRRGLPPNCYADAIAISFTAGKVLFAGEGGAVLTNNTELYEKLVWYSQHPYRQKKELGLSVTNEFALNGRIHPISAIWANAEFDSSLAKLEKRQAFCFKAISALNKIGLTAPVEFASQQIVPSFFRLSAEWTSAPQPKGLEHELCVLGFHLRVNDIPVKLLYRQNAFIAQYPILARKANMCPEAERQVARRFCLV